MAARPLASTIGRSIRRGVATIAATSWSSDKRHIGKTLFAKFCLAFADQFAGGKPKFLENGAQLIRRRRRFKVERNFGFDTALL